MTKVFCPIFGGSGRRMEEIKEVDFENERAMQAIVGDNLEVIFPDLEIVGHEISLKKNRFDTVAFNVRTKSFVLIEYKKVQNDVALLQGLAYLGILRGNEGNFLQACKEKSGKKYEKEDVAWDKTKVVLVAPSFTERQLAVAEQIDEPIELYRIGRYENRIITVEMIVGPKPEKRGKRDSANSKMVDLKTLHDNLEKVLQKDMQLEKEETKVYKKWHLKNGRVVCTIAKQAKTLVLCYTTSSLNVDDADVSFVRYMVKNGRKLGKKGRGDYMSTIRNAEDIKRAIRYVERVCIQEGGAVSNQKQQTGKNLSGQGDKKYVAQRGSKRTVGLYDKLKNALRDNIPNLEFVVRKEYINWKSMANGKSICTVAVNKNTLRLCYNTTRLEISRGDAGFIRYLFNNGKRLGKAGLGDYDSKIETDVDIERVIPYVKHVHLQKVG